jgi:hypothetical protein
MPEHPIFPSTNPYYSTQTEGGGVAIARRDGWCAAASALWCKSRFTGVAPASSDPDKLLTGILQVKYRWDPAGGGQDFINLYAQIERTAQVTFQNMSLIAMLTGVLNRPGVYHIRKPGHSMAVDTRGPTYYFYDIENGLFSYDSGPEFIGGVRSRYANAAALWMALTIT